MPLPSAPPLLLPMLIALSLSGCATREFVQQEVDGVGKRLDELQAMLDRANQRIDTNTRWLVETEGRVGKTEAGQAALNGRLDEMATDLAKTGAQVQAVAGNLATTGQRIDANAAAIASVNQRLDGLDGRLVAVASQADHALQGTAGHSARIAGLEGEIAAVKATLPSVTALAPAAPTEPAPATSPAPVAAVTTAVLPASVAMPTPADASVGQTRLDSVAARIDAATRQIDEHTHAILAASERLKAVEAGLATSDQRAAAMQGGLDAAGQRIASHDAAIASATKRIDNLEMTLTVAINKIENSGRQLVEQGGQIKALDERVGRTEKDIGLATTAAREALERAQAAGKLAEGKLVYETQLSDETAPFNFQSAELTDATKQLLSALANKLKAENQDVYLEIQGHTDASGSTEANRHLAMARAEAVRDYLHGAGGLALHRLAVVSYGETRPLADNKTREGRSKNRRVQIVVLK